MPQIPAAHRLRFAAAQADSVAPVEQQPARSPRSASTHPHPQQTPTPAWTQSCAPHSIHDEFERGRRAEAVALCTHPCAAAHKGSSTTFERCHRSGRRSRRPGNPDLPQATDPPSHGSARKSCSRESDQPMSCRPSAEAHSTALAPRRRQESVRPEHPTPNSQSRAATVPPAWDRLSCDSTTSTNSLVQPPWQRQRHRRQGDQQRQM